MLINVKMCLSVHNTKHVNFGLPCNTSDHIKSKNVYVENEVYRKKVYGLVEKLVFQHS